MFTKNEKIALIITGIEIIVMCTVLFVARRVVADRFGVSIKDLKTINTVEEANRLRNREA